VAIFKSSLRLFVALPVTVIRSLPEIVILFSGDDADDRDNDQKFDQRKAFLAFGSHFTFRAP